MRAHAAESSLCSEQAQIDAAVKASDREAVEMAAHLLRNDGLFVGSSSAVNCVGAVKTARWLGPGHTIVRHMFFVLVLTATDALMTISSYAMTCHQLVQLNAPPQRCWCTCKRACIHGALPSTAIFCHKLHTLCCHHRLHQTACVCLRSQSCAMEVSGTSPGSTTLTTYEQWA